MYVGWCEHDDVNDPIKYGCVHAYAVTVEGAERLLKYTYSCNHHNSSNELALSKQIHHLILNKRLKFDVYDDVTGCFVLRDGGSMFLVNDPKVYSLVSHKNNINITDYDERQQKRKYKLHSCGLFRQYKFMFGVRNYALR